MGAIENYTSAKTSNRNTIHQITHAGGRPNKLNFDATVAEREARIFRICQGFILKKFMDPKVSSEEKCKLAEKIYLTRFKERPDKEAGTSPAGGQVKVIIVRDGHEQRHDSPGGSLSRPLPALTK